MWVQFILFDFLILLYVAIGNLGIEERMHLVWDIMVVSCN
jgi:hypothetical protein